MAAADRAERPVSSARSAPREPVSLTLEFSWLRVEANFDRTAAWPSADFSSTRTATTSSISDGNRSTRRFAAKRSFKRVISVGLPSSESTKSSSRSWRAATSQSRFLRI